MLLALVWPSAGRTLAAEMSARPSFVFILADDLGYGELGCYGGRDIPTPHIDSLAADGVRFTQAYVTAAYCAASRAGLFTGRYQTRFGFEFNPVGAQNLDPAIGLPAGERTLADDLREAGYATALIGKWHLGGTAPFHPMRRGFDEFFGFLHEGHSFVPHPWPGVTTWLRRRTLPDGGQGRWTSPDGKLIYTTHMEQNEPPYDADNPVLRGGQPVDEQEHLTDAVAREAERFIERRRREPFLLVLSFNAVHSPMQGSDAYMAKFAHIENVHRRIFAAMLAHLDDAVGRVLRKLREAGLDENTLVVFMSDNGGPTRELTSRNDPLRGGKGELYEGGIRVPMLWRWKGRLPAGAVEVRSVISLDMAATALAAAGRDAAARKPPMDGTDLLPYLTGGRKDHPHERLYWRAGPKAALRQGAWKLVLERAGAWELYHLDQDIAESKNLAASRPETLSGLTNAWSELNEAMVAPLWGGSPRRVAPE
jgi:arylsulfatase A-like enzyme